MILSYGEITIANIDESYHVILSNEAQQIAVDSNRYPLSNFSFTTDVMVFRGSSEISDFTIGNVISSNGITVSVNSHTVTFAVKKNTKILADNDSIDIPITINGETITKSFSWSCAKAGANGASAKLVDVTPSSQIFKSTDGGVTFTPDTIILTPKFQGGLSYSAWQYSTNGGTSWNNITSGNNGLTIASGVLTINKTCNLYTNAITAISFKCVANESAYYDVVTVVKIYDVTELEIGGRNLALNTSSDYCEWKGTSFSGVTNTCFGIGKVLTDGLSVGDTLTIRLEYEYKNIVATSGQTAQCWLQGEGDATSWSSGSWTVSSKKTISGSGIHIFLHQFKITENHLRNSYWNVNIRHDYVQSGSIRWRKFKVERGTKATDWSPAPEDIQEQIKTVTETISGVKLTADQNAQKITEKVWQSDITTSINTYDGSTGKAIRDRVSQTETDISGITSTVSDMQTTISKKADGRTVSTLSNKVSTLEQDVSGFKQTVEDTYVTQDTFDNLEIGGRNLFRQSGRWTELPSSDYWKSNGGGIALDTTTKYNGYNTLKTTVGNGINGYHSSWIELEPNVEYTYSAIIKSSIDITGSERSPLHFHTSSDKSVNNNSLATVLSYNQSLTAGVWKRIYVTFKLVGNGKYWRPFVYSSSTSATFNIAYLQLEKGNRVTDWTPAIEDTDASIQSISSQVSTLEQTSNTISASVSSLTTTTTNLSNLVTNTQETGLRWKVNYSAFDTANGGEIYLHGINATTGADSNTDGWVIFNGAKITIPKGMINPNAMCPYDTTIYVVRRVSSSKTYLVWYNSGWKYGNIDASSNSTVYNWTWSDKDAIIGSFTEPSSEGNIENAILYNPVLSHKEITITEESKAELKILSDGISTKVEKNGVISAIRQSAETVKIQASKVDLEGAVSFSMLTNDLAKELTYDRDNLVLGTATSVTKSNIQCTGTYASGVYATFDAYNMVDVYSNLNLETGDKITLSFDYTLTNAPSGATISAGTNGSPYEYFGFVITRTASSQSGHITKTFTVTDSLKNSAGNKFRFRFNNCSGATFTVSKLKLEKGSKASNWSISPMDIKKTADTANTWVTNNGSNMLSLESMVKKWTGDAVSDTTYIKGGWIATNTITADKIALGDFTNYCNLNLDNLDAYGFTTYNSTTVANLIWWKPKTLARDTFISREYRCQGGENFRVKYRIYSNVKGQTTSGGTATPVYLDANIMFHITNDDGTKQWKSVGNIKPTSSSGTSAIINETFTMPDNARKFKLGLHLGGYATFSGSAYLTECEVYKMSDAELIVNGSITANKIATDAIKSTNYVANTSGSFLNLADGSFNSKNFKLDSSGNASLSGTITAKAGNIGGFIISSSSNTAAYTGHCYTNSFYRHSGDGTYEYEVGMKGDGTAATSTTNGSGADNLAFYVKRIDKGSSWSNAGNLFYVTHKGYLYAQNADIKGKITATSGSIAGWKIETNAITRESGWNNSTSGSMYIGDNGISVLDKFRVTSTGNIYLAGSCIAYNLSAANDVKLIRGKISDVQEGDVHSVARLEQTSNTSEFHITIGDVESDFGKIVCSNHRDGGAKGEIQIGKEVYVSKNYALFEHTPRVNTTSGDIEVSLKGHTHSYASSDHTHRTIKNNTYGIGMQTEAGTTLFPMKDGSVIDATIKLGSSTARFGQIYSSVSTISTSDRNLKYNIGSIDERFENAFMDFKPVSYMFKNIYETDGHDRLHYGFIAQDIESALNSNNISNDEAAMLCVSKLEEPDVLGNTERYGLRYEEFIALNTHMIQKLYKRIEELEKQLNDKSLA